jgi:hypothetical protein
METLDRLMSVALPIAWVVFAVGMTVRTRRILALPYRPDRAAPRDSARYGAFYALTFAMLPWKKESTRTHWATYTAGMVMHIAVFLAIVFALARLAGVGQGVAGMLLRLVGPLGLAAALGLLVKRAVVPHMRAISTPDDFISNALVDFYLLGGVLTVSDPDWAPLWRLAVVLLLLWVPVGKIYHMVLFFISRLLFGWQFGRRGVIRHAKPISY